MNWQEVGAICAVLALLGKIFLVSVRSVVKEELDSHMIDMDKRYMGKHLAIEKFSSLQQQINNIRKDNG